MLKTTGEIKEFEEHNSVISESIKELGDLGELKKCLTEFASDYRLHCNSEINKLKKADNQLNNLRSKMKEFDDIVAKIFKNIKDEVTKTLKRVCGIFKGYEESNKAIVAHR